jgi:hypothetical protein
LGRLVGGVWQKPGLGRAKESELKTKGAVNTAFQTKKGRGQ